jgi:tetratricopeptide (TPR) repeat protein
MPKPPPAAPDVPQPTEPTLETGFDEVPPEGGGKPGARPDDPEWVEATDTVTRPLAEEGDEAPPPAPFRTPRRPSRRLQIAAAAVVAVVVVGAGLLYRSHHRKQVLAQGLARAREVSRADTHAGYRDAAQLLEPLVAIDALEAGALRAWALAMLATDYRDAAAAREAEGLLIEPERATEVPPAANVAHAVLGLGAGKAGTAATYAARPGGGPLAQVVQARVALLAGNPAGALEALDAALAADARLPAALALKGDGLRRTRNAVAARQAYLAALDASPRHPRAAYGMAKLALSGQARAEEAIPALERVLEDRTGTPSNERARAALHLAALRGRAGDRAGAQRAIEAAGLSGGDRAWLEKAVAEEELARTGYRVVDGAPAALQSASDDDPYVPPPAPDPKAEAKKAEPRKAVKKSAAKPAKSSKKPKAPAKPTAKTPAKKAPPKGSPP